MKRIKNIKIWLPRIVLFTLFLVFTDIASISQVPTGQSDTTKVSQGQGQTQTQAQTQNQGEVQESVTGKTVKQVRKSARPDMSKAKGARPNIVRPSGSTIPRGVGKPGGARRIGGR